MEIGVVGRPHNIHGEVRAFLHNPASDLVASSRDIWLRIGRALRVYRVVDIRKTAKHHLILFEGVTSRAEAAALNGAKLLVPRDRWPEIAEDEFYAVDLLGLEAWEGERRLGRVTASREAGGVEIVSIQGQDGELEVPLVDAFVETIDWTNRRLELRDTVLLRLESAKSSPA